MSGREREPFFKVISGARGAGSRRSAQGSRLTPQRLALCSTAEARKLITYEQARNHRVLPLGAISQQAGAIGPTLMLACAAGEAVAAMAMARFVAGGEVRCIELPADDLDAAIFIAYRGDAQGLNAALAKIEGDESPQPISRAPLLRDGHSEVSQFLAELIEYAAACGASDLHLTPKQGGSFVSIRKSGALLLREAPISTLSVHRQALARIKVLSSLSTVIQGMPQEGAFRFPAAGGEIPVRVSIFPTLHGERLVLRFVGNAPLPPLTALGLEPEVLNALQSESGKSEGLILIAGPTGSGKSTTLYAIAENLAALGRAVVTVEDPVERSIPAVTQSAVNPERGFTYAAAAKAVLRQDPDVLLIGEIRDAETALVALEAAMTGHLVLSTVHARCCEETLMRLDKFCRDPLLISQTVRLIITQRILPRLCARCRVLDLEASRLHSCTAMKRVGCQGCGYSGIDGVTVTSEALQIDSVARQWIREGRGIDGELLSRLTHSKVTPALRDSYLRRLAEGEIEAGEVAVLD